MKRVLFVDDNPDVLEGLRRMMRPMRRRWELHFAASALEALELLDRVEPAVIVSDMRMPVMDGAALLEEVVERKGNVARIVLSGHADAQSAMKTAGLAHRYLAKPCDADGLRRAIGHALHLRDIMTNDKLAAIAASLGTLPSLPSIYAELCAALDSDDASPRRIGEIVRADIAISAKLLQLVNSAFFGAPRTVSSVERAVCLLGVDTIRGLVLANGVFRALAGSGADEAVAAGLWRESVEVGALAREIAILEAAPACVVDDAMQGGILHDVGRIVFGIAAGEQYRQLAAEAARGERRLVELERERFDCDHAELGAYLLGLWGLPDSLVRTVSMHHGLADPAGDGFDAAVAVHVADALWHAAAHGPDSPDARIDAAFVAAARCPGRVDDWRGLAAQRLCPDPAS